MKFKKSILFISIISCALSTIAQNQKIIKLWETDSTFKIPESVLYSPEENLLYVSNIDGKSNEKDLKGSITKMSIDGKSITHRWAINLSSPKGMAIFDKNLYVADLDEVVILDLNNGRTLKRIPIEGSIFLNDLTINKQGIIYVSDSRTGKVHQIKNNNVSTYLENKNSVNGLLADGDELYLLVKDTLFKSDKNNMLTVITTGLDESSDGIIQTSNKDFIVSCWNGIIYYVKNDGNKEVLLDTRAQKINTADIGFDAVKSILYVPTFFKNKVIAYQLK